MDVPKGTLEGDLVVLKAGRGASALHSKGSHGIPKSGGGLELSLVEAAYLVESDRLRVVDGGGAVGLLELLAKGAEKVARFEPKYLAYRDLRERGFVVREEPASAKMDFSLRARGSTAKSPSTTWVLAEHERGEFRPSEAMAFAERARGLGKQALVAVVDEEGDVTYYSLEEGLKAAKPAPAGSSSVRGTLAGKHVLLSAEASRTLNEGGEMFGKPLKSHLRLSLTEAAFLMKAGRLALDRSGGGPLSVADVARLADVEQADFRLRLSAYTNLREEGLLPKTGFKYGSDFRVYEREGGTPHARFLVHVVRSAFSSSWSELARAVRLAHGVKKRYALALVAGDGRVRYLQVWWSRP